MFFFFKCLPFTYFFPGSNHNRPMDPAKRAQLARKLDKKVATVGFACTLKRNSGERAGGPAAAKAEREIEKSFQICNHLNFWREKKLYISENSNNFVMSVAVKRGALIVFEGCDRSGKTTQARCV